MVLKLEGLQTLDTGNIAVAVAYIYFQLFNYKLKNGQLFPYSLTHLTVLRQHIAGSTISAKHMLITSYPSSHNLHGL